MFVQRNADTLQTTIDIITSLPGFQKTSSELLGFETVEKCILMDREVFCQGRVERSSSDGVTMELRHPLDGFPAFCEYGTKTSIVQGLEDNIHLSTTWSNIFFAIGYSLLAFNFYPSYPSTGSSGNSNTNGNASSTTASANRDGDVSRAPPQ